MDIPYQVFSFLLLILAVASVIIPLSSVRNHNIGCTLAAATARHIFLIVNSSHESLMIKKKKNFDVSEVIRDL